jgi:hypothetical protein
LVNKNGLDNGVSKYGNIGLEVSLDPNALVPDNNDCLNCKTAEQSLKYNNQCAIIGPIMENNITSVHFYAGDDLILTKPYGHVKSGNFSEKEILLLTGEEIDINTILSDNDIYLTAISKEKTS